MWLELTGRIFQYSGTGAATVTLDPGVSIHQIIAHATGGNGTIVILGGATITVIAAVAPISIQFQHTLAEATAAANTVVFAGNIDTYYIHGVRSGNV